MRFRPSLLVFVVAAWVPIVACDRTDRDAFDRTSPHSPGVALVGRALTRFTASSKPSSGTTDPRISRLLARFRVEDNAGAIAECDAILRKEPAHLHARYFKAFAHHRMKLYAAARPDFEAVLAGGPRFPKAEGAFLYYAWCCFYLGDLDTAAAAFDAVWTLDIDRADARYGLGLIAIERGELERAESLLRESLRLAEESLEKKGSSATISDQKNVAKAKVRIAGVLLQRAELEPETSASRLKEARNLGEDAVKVIPNSEETWFALSRIYARLGEKQLEQLARDTMKQGRESLPEVDSEPR